MEKENDFLRKNTYLLKQYQYYDYQSKKNKTVRTLKIDGINFGHPIQATEPLIKRAIVKKTLKHINKVNYLKIYEAFLKFLKMLKNR